MKDAQGHRCAIIFYLTLHLHLPVGDKAGKLTNMFAKFSCPQTVGMASRNSYWIVNKVKKRKVLLHCYFLIELSLY